MSSIGIANITHADVLQPQQSPASSEASIVKDTSETTEKAAATQHIYGLFFNPAAYIVTKGIYRATIDAQHYSDNEGRYYTGGLTVAIGLSSKTEIRGGYYHLTNGNNWHLGAKQLLLNPSTHHFGLTVGTEYYQVTDNSSHKANFYAVATKVFELGGNARFEGTLGLRYNQYSAGGNQADIYTGICIPLQPDDGIYAIGEWGTKRSKTDQSPYALGVRYHPKGKSYNVGVGIANRTVFLQSNYIFQ